MTSKNSADKSFLNGIGGINTENIVSWRQTSEGSLPHLESASFSPSPKYTLKTVQPNFLQMSSTACIAAAFLVAKEVRLL